MSHLMSDDNTDGTIVDGIVEILREEWRLEDTCREADLVGGWVVVGIDSLRSHEPLVLINWLVVVLLLAEVPVELACSHHILEEALLWVDSKARDVFPLIRITHLDIESRELLESHLLCLFAHPFLCLDHLTERCLEVGNELHHALL